ncbi:MAG: protein TolR [Pseudomonadota bacterium]|jgi:biopolymer transport protein TolR
MALHVNGRGAGRKHRPMSEINVTPLVDVMLVLLIVFMVTAPLLTVGVPIDLPKADAKPLAEDDKPLTVAVDRKGAIFIEDTEVDADELVARLAAIAGERRDARIYVRGDRDLAYGEVMAVVARISGAGFSKVALVTEKSQTADINRTK